MTPARGHLQRDAVVLLFGGRMTWTATKTCSENSDKGYEQFGQGCNPRFVAIRSIVRETLHLVEDITRLGIREADLRELAIKIASWISQRVQLVVWCLPFEPKWRLQR
jgi:hypothetical protein